jgi:hypothetical protein
MTFGGVDRLQEQLSRSERVVSWIAQAGKRVKIKEAVRASLVAGSIQLAIEHHAAMAYLAKGRHYASLLALSRSIYEAYLWGTWTLWIATQEQLIELAHDRLSPSLEKMIRDLDQRKFFDKPMLTEMKSAIERMDGFVHGGFEHLRHRIHAGRVHPEYPVELIVDALKMADLFAVMALLDGPAIDQDIGLGDALYSEARGLLDLSNPVS